MSSVEAEHYGRLARAVSQGQRVVIEADEGYLDIKYTGQVLDPVPNFLVVLLAGRVDDDRNFVVAHVANLDRWMRAQLLNCVGKRPAGGVHYDDKTTDRHCDCFQITGVATKLHNSV